MKTRLDVLKQRAEDTKAFKFQGWMRELIENVEHRDIKINIMRKALIDVQFCGDISCWKCLKIIKTALGESHEN